MSKPRTPTGLDRRGAAFWRTTTTDYELSDSELQVLTECCRTLDDLDRLAEVIRADGATTTGSTGQTVVHPALTEARGQRLVLHRLLAALALPDDEGGTVPTVATTKARKAADARWRDHRQETVRRAKTGTL